MMKYMGSKRRIAKHIIPIMVAAANSAGITRWVEPFVGGANLIDKVPDYFDRYGYDINEHVIHALLDIRDRCNDLPEAVSEIEYKEMIGADAGTITSWCRFALSFGGKFDGGYAREFGSDDTTFCGYGKRNAKKQSPLIKSVHFEVSAYNDLSFTNSLIYCDPPYQDTTGYKTDKFDHDHFFKWCREMAKENIVFVSEYQCPSDFKEVWSGRQKTNFSSSRDHHTNNAVEKLFIVK